MNSKELPRFTIEQVGLDPFAAELAYDAGYYWSKAQAFEHQVNMWPGKFLYFSNIDEVTCRGFYREIARYIGLAYNYHNNYKYVPAVEVFREECLSSAYYQDDYFQSGFVWKYHYNPFLATCTRVLGGVGIEIKADYGSLDDSPYTLKRIISVRDDVDRILVAGHLEDSYWLDNKNIVRSKVEIVNRAIEL